MKILDIQEHKEKPFSYPKIKRKKDYNFCKSILEKNIDDKNIMFTDEVKIDMSPYTRDSIHLTKSSQKKLKKGGLYVSNLINREQRKFEKSIMIATGISFYGLGPLMILEGTLNEIPYGQALFYYKEKIDFLNEKYNIEFKFEQDGAKLHTSKSNTILLDKFFGEGNWIQNPQNSPDFAYPIEIFWRF